MEARLADSLPARGRQVAIRAEVGRFSRARLPRRRAPSTLGANPASRSAATSPKSLATLRALPFERFVLDGELVIEIDGRLSFDALQMRLHPAESRIRKLAAETPARLVLFDFLLAPDGAVVAELPLQRRRRALEAFGRKARLDRHALHPRSRRSRALAFRLCGHRRRRRQAPRPPLRGRRARDGQGQADADRRLRGRRLPLRDGSPAGRIAVARPLRRRGPARPCRLHLDDRNARAGRPDAPARSAARAAGLHRARRPAAPADGAPSAAANGSRCGPNSWPRCGSTM